MLTFKFGLSKTSSAVSDCLKTTENRSTYEVVTLRVLLKIYSIKMLCAIFDILNKPERKCNN